MKILNQDCTRCNQSIDLSAYYPVDSGHYTIVQHIDAGHATYTIIDHLTGQIVYPDKWRIYSLKQTDGSTLRVSGKQIVRAVYNSALCIDNIPDLPGEVWCFVDSYFLGAKHRETFLVSNKARIKTYTDNVAHLMHPDKNVQSGRWEVKFGEIKRERPTVHRLVGYYFCWKRDKPDLAFDRLHIHHKRTLDDNQADNLQAMTPEEHTKLHADRRRDHKRAA